MLIRGGLILGLILFLAVKWKDWSVAEVSAKRLCRERSIFFGEETSLTFLIENRKILPLPWIQWEMDWPEGLHESDKPDRERLLVTSSLLPYQRLKRKVKVAAKKRGYYVFKETKISIGDLFGLTKGQMTDERYDSLSVYPKVEALESILPLAVFPQGQVSVRRWILPDLYQPIGAREYQPGDPLRTMDWKATARRGALMVREFGYTAEPRLSILLNLGQDFRNLVRPEARERLISFGASLGVHAIEEKIPVAFATNAFLRAEDPCMEGIPVWHAGRERLILEKAARIADQVEEDFQAFLQKRLMQTPKDTTVVVVAASLSKKALLTVEEARSEGRSVQLALLDQATMGKSDWQIPNKGGAVG